MSQNQWSEDEGGWEGGGRADLQCLSISMVGTLPHGRVQATHMTSLTVERGGDVCKCENRSTPLPKPPCAAVCRK